MAKLICSNCHKEMAYNQFKNHLIKLHGDLSEHDKINVYQDSMPYTAYTKIRHLTYLFNDYLITNKIFNTIEKYKSGISWYARSFNSFCETMLLYRNLELSDITLYFNVYIPYKKKNPCDVTSFKLAEVFCNGNKEEAEKFYEKVIKPRNGYTGHGSLLSPWSKDFIGYKDMSEEEMEYTRKIKGFNSIRDDFDQLNNSCRIEYFINRGMSEDEAKLALKKRQTTFSLEKCIERYGEEKGIEVFNKRQEKWLMSLNTPENIEKVKNGQMRGFKTVCGKSYSKISQLLFHIILNKLSIDKSEVYFGENNGLYVVTVTPVKHPMLDFYIPKLNKWIEFDGDYWHNKDAETKERDKRREEAIKSVMPNIELKRILERDYRANPEKIIEECINWINS